MRLLRQSTYRARQLRRAATPAERHLWKFLRNRRLEGAKFRRQHPVGDAYIVDFFCLEAALVVEADGAPHFPPTREQLVRDTFLSACGLLVLRFENCDILDDTERVLGHIRFALRERLPPPSLRGMP